MTDETIKINREMLRDAFNKELGKGWQCEADAIEHALFGPKKPREFYINIYPSLGRRCLHDSRAEADDFSDGHRGECVRVREVIGDE